MSGVLTGSLAFAGFVLAAETYRSYKEQEEAKEEEKILEPAVAKVEAEVVKEEESLPAEVEQVAVDAKVEEAVVPIVAKEEAVEEVAVVVQEVKVEVKEAPGVA